MGFFKETVGNIRESLEDWLVLSWDWPVAQAFQRKEDQRFVLAQDISVKKRCKYVSGAEQCGYLYREGSLEELGKVAAEAAPVTPLGQDVGRCRKVSVKCLQTNLIIRKAYKSRNKNNF